MKTWWTLWKRLSLIFALVFSIVPNGTMVFAEEQAKTTKAGALPTGEIISTEWITAGAKLEKWAWETEVGKVKINLIEVDTKNPYIKVDGMIGKNSQTGNKQKIINMAEENKAVAAINGDFFTLTAEGAPFGVHLQGGQMITSPGYIHSKNAFMINQEGVPSIDRLDFDAEVVTESGASFQLFGINKTQYAAGFRFRDNSHTNRLHMYTPDWNITNWVGTSFSQYTVVVVENDRVIEILENQKVKEIPENGYILFAHGEAEKFVKEQISVRDEIKVNFKLNTDQILNTAVDGSTLLVNNGQKAQITYEIKGNHARTAVGFSKDQRYIYFVSIEKGKNSVGMSLDQLSSFLLQRGVWKAVNLDGGGSTTMVSRPLGSFKLKDVTIPQYGAEREVPNGLAIFSTAPKGKLLGWNIEFPKGVLINEPFTYKAKAYDEYYNPINPKELSIQLKYPTMVNQNEDGMLSVNQSGTLELGVTLNGKTEKHSIKAYGKEDIKELNMKVDTLYLHPNEERKVNVEMAMLDGNKISVKPELLNWSLVGIKGQVKPDGTLVASDSESSTGLLKASYQGFSTSVPVVIGYSEEKRVIDTFDIPTHYLIQGLVGTEKGTMTVSEEMNEKIGTFSYDFGDSNDLRIAYLKYGTLGKSIHGEPALISLNVKGDQSGHWLRTEIRDANGKVYYVDLAQKIDWNGWKTITAPLPSEMAYPIKMNSIYVVHLENDKDSTVNKGILSFSKLQIQDWKKPDPMVVPKITFTLGKKEVLVDNDKKILDQTPIIKNGRTFLPLRHVTELIGGRVDWLSSEKKVEVYQNKELLEFWLQVPYMSDNGQRRDLSVAPFTQNGRTMIPLRDVVEAFDLYISYDSKTKQIMIHSN